MQGVIRTCMKAGKPNSKLQLKLRCNLMRGTKVKKNHTNRFRSLEQVRREGMLPANDIENLACVESTRFMRSLKMCSLVMQIILLLFIRFVLWLPNLRTFALGNESTIINLIQKFNCDTGFQRTFVMSNNSCFPSKFSLRAKGLILHFPVEYCRIATQ